MPAFACQLDDGTGQISVIFGGVLAQPGVVVGARLHVEGTALADDASLVLWNPAYHFEDAPCEPPAPPGPVDRRRRRSRTSSDTG